MPIDPKLSDAMYDRDSWKCRKCGRRDTLTPHHIVFKSHGGADTIQNLITLCMEHHNEVHAYQLVLSIISFKGDWVDVKFERKDTCTLPKTC